MSFRGGGTEKEKVFERDKTAGGSFSPPAYSGVAPVIHMARGRKRRKSLYDRTCRCFIMAQCPKRSRRQRKSLKSREMDLC